METAINIVKNILLPELEKDNQYSEQKSTSEFWEQFTRFFLDFENDAKPVYALIYSLELADAEKIIDKMSHFYIAFSNELAENYVLNQNSEASDYLISTNNQTFIDHVQFYKTLQNVVKKVERKRIKQALPDLHEKLNFELSEIDITNATKKKGREDLKSKMKVWEEELDPQKRGMIFYSLPNEKKAIPKQKVISLSWIKYAIAACVVLGVGILFFNNNFNNIAGDNGVVTTDTIKNPKNKINNNNNLTAPVLAQIEIQTQNASVLMPSELGFTPSETPKITVRFMDASKRIASLEIYIADSENSKSDTFLKYKTELNDLLISKNNYIFDGKTITLFENATNCKVLQTKNKDYFLKLGNDFLILKLTPKPLTFEKVRNTKTIEILEKIIFDNE